MGLVCLVVALVLFILGALAVALPFAAQAWGLVFLTLAFLFGGISWPWTWPGRNP
jgi:hypothetical protein